ncbi:MAG: glycosyltransferase family 2 protein [Deltaproteobacteria bacterium]
MKINSNIAVVVPAFQVAKNITQVLEDMPDYIQWIIIVDDCSSDGTYESVTAKEDPRVCLIRHSENQGVGGAVLSGYNMALTLGADIVVKMDGDGQMDPQYLPLLLQPIIDGEADYVKGNRFLHSEDLAQMPWIRRIGNNGLSFWCKLTSGYWSVFDPTNGYTAIHSSIIPLLDNQYIDKRYFFEISMLIELGLIRAVVKDVYIPAYYGNEVSSLSPIHSLFSFPWKLRKGFFRRMKIQYFIRDVGVFSVFLVIGLLMSSFGFIWGIVNWFKSVSMGVSTSTGTVMIAVLPLLLGIQFILQALLIDINNAPATPVFLYKQKLLAVSKKLDPKYLSG